MLVYEALHPFHLWAWIAAACASALSVTAAYVLAVSPRLSRRWWLGMGILILCLLTVAFGARSRATAYDLRPSTRGCDVPGCGVATPEVAAAQHQVTFLGIVLLVATVLTIVATAASFLLRRRTDAVRHHAPFGVVGLLLAIFVAGCGAFLLANSIAGWIEFADLADISRAGDALGAIPLEEAIVGTVGSAIMLTIGLAVTIACSAPRLRPTLTSLQSQE